MCIDELTFTIFFSLAPAAPVFPLVLAAGVAGFLGFFSTLAALAFLALDGDDLDVDAFLAGAIVTVTN